MPYTRTTYSTSVSAAQLNNGEAGIEDVDARATALESGRAVKPAGTAVLYVDPAGSDSNDGKSWGTAKATITAAHTALPATGGTIHVTPSPSGIIDHSAQLTLTKCVRLIASGRGFPTANAPCRLRFAAGVSGVLVDTASQFSHLEGFVIESQSTGAGSDVGLRVKGHGVTVDDVTVEGFGSHGVYFDTTAGGNANCCKLTRVRSNLNRGDGFRTAGADSNAITFDACDASNNSGWGLNHVGGNSNVWNGPGQIDNNTLGAVKDTGLSNQYYNPYIEGPPLAGQNVDLSGATDAVWVGQGWGLATFTPAPAFSCFILQSGQIDKYLKIGNDIDGAGQAQWMIGSGSYFTGYFSIANQTDGVVVLNVNKAAANATRVAFNVPPQLPTFTTAGRPNAATMGAGAMIYVSDAAAGSKLQYSDGAAWVAAG